MTPHQFHASILRAYDIRGIFGETLRIDDARALGAAFGTAVHARGGNAVVVGQDGRSSSPALANALCEGLASTGIAVKRIGLGPTPMLYFAERFLGADAGIMVTGSHNPPDHNGFKMVIGTESVYGDAIQKLGEIAGSGDFALGNGTIEDCSVADAYIGRLVKDAAMARPLSVVWDAGNGAAGPTLMRLCERLPGNHILINENVDGRFPAHHPDPADPAAMVQLQETVVAQECDLGIAFDGDGDRIGVVDREGRILWGDQLLALLAQEVLEAQPGATVIADVKASQVLFDEVARLGGNPLMWRTGHSLIKAKMIETGALLAGEMSGHIYFADRYYGFDDALYAAVRVLNMVSRHRGGLVVLRNRLRESYTTPEIRVPVDAARKFAIVAEVGRRLAKRSADVTAIDGVRVNTEDGWWLLRASNTQEVLVVRAEASNPDRLRELCIAIAEQLCVSGVSITHIDGLLATQRENEALEPATALG
jgi:phosphomannomutase